MCVCDIICTKQLEQTNPEVVKIDLVVVLHGHFILINSTCILYIPYIYIYIYI